MTEKLELHKIARNTHGVHIMQQNKETHRSLEKALEVLISFMPYNEEVGTVDLSQKLGFHRSTASRLLHVLEKYGFVQQSPQSKKFSLGPSVVHLGWAVSESLNNNLTKIAIPYIDDLRNRVEETVVLEVGRTHHTIIAYIAEGPGPVRIKGMIGDRHGFHAAAGAKTILAFSSTEFRERIFGEELVRYSPNTVTEPGRVAAALERIKEQGFAFDDEERNEGIRAFGCPIFNYGGVPVAAVVVAGPAQRITSERHSEIVPMLKDTAKKISSRLCYKEDLLSETR
ncbi:MAG: IclR family transcriptional regulator [Proteobacteria bacterium]|nr:IclR family transcriptional regulator [Pseudomonadota bacterium]